MKVNALCSLYKPILRRFRAFLRKEFDQNRGPSLYQHWKPNVYMSEVLTYMVKKLHLPEELLDTMSVLKVLTILFPSTIKKVLPGQYVT